MWSKVRLDLEQLFYVGMEVEMIRERYLISKNDLDKVNNLIESIEVLSRTLIERPDNVNVELYAERIHNAVNNPIGLVLSYSSFSNAVLHCLHPQTYPTNRFPVPTSSADTIKSSTILIHHSPFLT